MPKKNQKCKIRAICEYCLYHKEIEPNVGVVKTNFGIEGNDLVKIREWVKNHRKDCHGNILAQYKDDGEWRGWNG